MHIPDDLDGFDGAVEVIEDLIGALQELHHKLEVTDDLSEYGVIERFIAHVEAALERYDSLE